ncbi:uncharacterized protein DS421_11g345510 [Arachis hypogaea]|nr:uncharacterized protein DS421_11g345510 [Arachis hypogaea]
MSEEKKVIVRDLGFGGLMHIPPIMVHQKLLKKLANSFKLGKNTLETSYGSFRVKTSTIGAALGLNASGDLFPQKVSYKELSEENKHIFRRFQGKTLKNLTDEMMSIGVGNEQDLLMFKRIFILYIQMAFLLPTTINKISSVHLDKKGEERPAQPWIANWNREQLVERMRAEMVEHMSETEEDSEEPKRKQPTRTAKKTQSKKGKLIVEDSSPKQTQSYDGESKKKKTNEKAVAQRKKGAPLPSTKGHYESSEKIPESLVEESTNDPAEQNMMVVRVETQSQTEALSIVSIQVYLPLSQTTPVPEIEPTPAKSPSEKISEERTKITPEPPKPDESTPTVPPAPSKINPAPEDVAALMMMSRTASYIPKEGLMPSFSLGLTDSSQEEAATQEGESAKTPKMPKLIEQLGELVEKITSSEVKTEGKSQQIQKQSGEESFEKFETPLKSNEISAEMKEKCYVWATRVKTYGDGNTNEYDPVCTLKAQDQFILSKIHFASLKADTHVEAEIVTAICLILNQENIKRFQEEIYCLPPDIVNMAIENHPNGKFLQPKTKKPFKVEDYLMFKPFLDLKKVASHPYWLEIIHLENVKRGKYEWENWTQDEVDHYRVEYAFRILFHGIKALGEVMQ